jgi:flagellar hook-basal body complex protein FliE
MQKNAKKCCISQKKKIEYSGRVTMTVSSNLSINQVKGDFVNMNVTNPRHIGGAQSKGTLGGVSFGDMLSAFIEKANDMENRSAELTNQMAIDPDSVDIADVQIAAEEAEMSVLFTKNIVDKAIRAYKEIINLR